jgi:hypothetical protein
MSWLERLVQRSSHTPTVRPQLAVREAPARDPDDPEVEDEFLPPAAPPQPTAARHVAADEARETTQPAARVAAAEVLAPPGQPERAPMRELSTPPREPSAPQRSTQPAADPRLDRVHERVQDSARDPRSETPSTKAAVEVARFEASAAREPAAPALRGQPARTTPANAASAPEPQALVPAPSPLLTPPAPPPARLTIGRVVVEVTPPARPAASPKSPPVARPARTAAPARARRSFQRFGLEST